ncbi:hypothetical protein BJV82DRAFT_545838, partial [Fennellomyces sp. T-0311]
MVINSLISSRLWHAIRITPVTQDFLRKFRSIITKFLAAKNFPAVRFDISTRPRNEGGLGVLDPVTQMMVLQLRWVLPLLSVDGPPMDSFIMPILRFCLRTYAELADVALPLLFPNARSPTILGMSSFKNLFAAADKLGLQPNFGSFDPRIIYELPIRVLCPDLPRTDPSGRSIPWHMILVKDAFYYNPALQCLWRRQPGSRSSKDRLTTKFLAMLSEGTCTIITPLRTFFEMHGSPFPPGSCFIFCSNLLLQPTLRSGIGLTEITPKLFRSSSRPSFITLPHEYPRAPKSVWSAFWRANFPHHAHTILWRAYHHKLPTQSRLQGLNIPFALDGRCPLCGETETDRHFVWDCPVKQ